MDINWWWVVGIIAPLGAPALLRVTIIAVEQWQEWRRPKLSYAPQDEVVRLEDVLHEFMPRVVGVDFEDCYISDESSLYDFEPELPVENSLKRIEEAYGLTPAELPDLRLVAICDALARRGV